MNMALREGIVVGLFALLTFFAAATSAKQGPAKQERTSSPEAQTVQESTAHTTFVLQLISDGILCPMDDRGCEDKDIMWKNFNLLASDGHTLDLASIPFPSVGRSKKHFDISTRAADKIMRRSPESNSKGDQIGERVLGLCSEPKDVKSPTGALYKLFWTWGANYWEVRGEHLEDVLALEQRLREQGIDAVWRWH
jgi:hypothetical protein